MIKKIDKDLPEKYKDCSYLFFKAITKYFEPTTKEKENINFFFLRINEIFQLRAL